MEIIFVLIPVSLLLLGAAIWGFLWAVRSGQFDDLDSPAYRILMEEDERREDDTSGAESGQEEAGRDDDRRP